MSTVLYVCSYQARVDGGDVVKFEAYFGERCPFESSRQIHHARWEGAHCLVQWIHHQYLLDTGNVVQCKTGCLKSFKT